ncbi:MAG TPA: hypothetical protein VK163_15900, partial [Opitutaceae bacterium]|nr:hypothetical protein [Opitutaceae bacterium]
PDGDVFVGNLHREFVLRHLHGTHGYNSVTTQAAPAPAVTPDSPFRALPPASAYTAFEGLCTPLPSHYRFSYGFNIWPIDGARYLSLHADSDLIVPVPAAATRIRWEYCILRDAYERADSGTNGVEFIIDGETPDGAGRRLFRRLLDPVATPADRGIQILDLPFTPRPGERLIFRTRDNGSPSFDWAAFRHILVH